MTSLITHWGLCRHPAGHIIFVPLLQIRGYCINRFRTCSSGEYNQINPERGNRTGERVTNSRNRYIKGKWTSCGADIKNARGTPAVGINIFKAQREF